MQVQRSVEMLQSSRLVLNLPPTFVNHKVEVLVVTLDEPDTRLTKRRTPPPALASKAKDLGDVFSSVPFSDWGITE